MSALDDLLSRTYGLPKADGVEQTTSPGGVGPQAASHVDASRTFSVKPTHEVTPVESALPVPQPAPQPPSAETVSVQRLDDQPSPPPITHEATLSVERTVDVDGSPDDRLDLDPASFVVRVDDPDIQSRSQPAIEPSAALELTTEPRVETAGVPAPGPETISSVTTDPIEEERQVVEETPAECTSSPASATESFKVEWEVDNFLWPAVCDDFRQRVPDELARAASQIAEAYRRESLGALVVTGARQDVGRTTMAISLARELAASRSVALVDLDHEHPSLMERLGVILDQGLESIDGKSVTAPSISVRAIEENVTLVPLASKIPSAHCLYEEVQKVLLRLSESHDILMLDASVEVAELLGRYGANLNYGSILVKDQRGGDPKDRLDDIMQRLETSALAMGVIENYAA